MFRKKEHKKIVILCRERKREIEKEWRRQNAMKSEKTRNDGLG